MSYKSMTRLRLRVKALFWSLTGDDVGLVAIAAGVARGANALADCG